MGLTPLEGLVMGTRSGDIDPGVVFHLHRVAGMSIDDIDVLLNRKSGMIGLSGVNDFRDVHKLIGAGDSNAKLALDVWAHRLKKYIGAYYAVLGTVDALTFTAGVGENDAVVRALVLEGLQSLGISVDAERNRAADRSARVISPEGSPVTVLVVPTNEELAIAEATLETIG
jgi:acetate kinase